MEVLIRDLRFERDGRRILDVPSLSFPSGSTTAIFGPNGSGKSTLLEMIAGLQQPTTGSIAVGGVPAAAGPGARVALTFQEAVFLRGSVRWNLELGLALRQVPAAERNARTVEAARECGIEPLLGRNARKLSAGEAQRVNLARALALRAPVTLLDEPLAGVDRVARQLLLEDLPRLLGTFASTVVIVTHDREEAFRLADRLVVLVDGTVRAAGPKGEVYRRPADSDTAALLGYTVLASGSALLAVPPGGLRQGGGESAPRFDFLVGRTVDMGNHRHATGTIAGRSAELRLGVNDPEPVPGSTIEVHAVQHVTVS